MWPPTQCLAKELLRVTLVMGDFSLCVTTELREELLPPCVWACRTHGEIVNR